MERAQEAPDLTAPDKEKEGQAYGGLWLVFGRIALDISTFSRIQVGDELEIFPYSGEGSVFTLWDPDSQRELGQVRGLVRGAEPPECVLFPGGGSNVA